ncbi:MAG TPA: malectin [Acidobacteriota bacterium]|nr:malectin [Acidobacteriota bacterium]
MKRFLTISVILALVSVIFLGVLSAQGKFVLRVNAGDAASYTDKAGNVWKGDKDYKKGGGYGFVGGDTVDRGSSMKIEGTNDPKIYQTERYSMDKFVAEVPNGKYTVRLHFAETYDGIDTDGPRVFDVQIQNQNVLKDLDVSKAAGKVQKALVKEFKGISVTNGILDITFVAKQQNPEINGIEILAE